MELNESELIERELTIRSLRLTKEVLETRRSIVRWLALSLGIINPGESRLGAIAVLDSLVYFQFVRRVDPSVKDLAEYITQNWGGINEKTLRYHLLQMKKTGYLENSQGTFYFKPVSVGDRYDPKAWIYGIFESQYKDIADRIGDAIKELKNKVQ